MAKTGRKAHHDLLDPAVQDELLRQARAGEVTLWWLAFVCSSFCARQIRNCGTRTMASPAGAKDGPQWERDGTEMATFAAKLLLCAMESGAIVTAENTAPDSRYPKAWDLPAWQRVLRLPDVRVVPLEMCQYGLRADDESGYHRKRTWLVTNAAGLHSLVRKCPNTRGGSQASPGRALPPPVSTPGSSPVQRPRCWRRRRCNAMPDLGGA